MLLFVLLILLLQFVLLFVLLFLLLFAFLQLLFLVLLFLLLALECGGAFRMEALDKELRSPAQPLVTQNYRFLGFINDVGEALHSFLPKPIYVRSWACQ